MKPIWPKSPPKFVAAALSGHSAIGLAVGALMYILCVSGTIAVFYRDTGRWEQPSSPEYTSVAPEALTAAATAILAKADKPPSNIFIYLPTEDRPRFIVSAGGNTMQADDTGKLVAGEDRDFTRFLLNLHIYLHLPGTFGLTFVGMLGAMLAGLIISGFLAHPRVFRDAFTFRLGGAKRLSEADLHNRLSVWGAPFHLVIAVTGAMLGVSSVLAFAVAAVAYDGDTKKVYEPLFGVELKAEDTTPAPLADVAATYRHFTATHPELTPVFVRVVNPGTLTQWMEVNALHPDRLIYAELYRYTSAGQPIGTAGISTGPVGQQAFASSYQLHFGSFGSGWIRIAYGILGVALCIVTATGLNIWLIKRREKGRPAPRLERAWIGVVWGTPLALAACVALATAGVDQKTLVPMFWSMVVAIIAGCIAAHGNQTISRTLRIATGVLLLVGLGVQASHEGALLFGPAGLPVTLGIIALAATAIGSAAGMFGSRRAREAIAPAE